MLFFQHAPLEIIVLSRFGQVLLRRRLLRALDKVLLRMLLIIETLPSRRSLCSSRAVHVLSRVCDVRTCRTRLERCGYMSAEEEVCSSSFVARLGPLLLPWVATMRCHLETRSEHSILKRLQYDPGQGGRKYRLDLENCLLANSRSLELDRRPMTRLQRKSWPKAFLCCIQFFFFARYANCSADSCLSSH